MKQRKLIVPEPYYGTNETDIFFVLFQERKSKQTTYQVAGKRDWAMFIGLTDAFYTYKNDSN